LLALRPNPSAAVALNVHTGGIIAAVSRPAYDPNEFAMGVSASLLSELLGDPSKPMFNRISHARYPPASTFKMVVAYAILTNRLVDPARVLVYCTGGHRFGNRVFKCWKPEGHGGMNLMSAVVNSCDVYFYRIAEMMDVDMLAESAIEFGFDKKTGIDLPIEVAGNVPSRRYYDKRHGKGRWTQGLMLNNTIGQGEYLGTVLHVARMSAAIANGGWLVEPHFVDHLAGEEPLPWERIRVEHLTGTTLSFLQRAMLEVVDRPGGTAYWLRVPWLRIAGKTGTAENPHGDDHSWFTAYAPADDPEVAVAVMVENAGHGSEVAAPIVRNFLVEYFRDLKPLVATPPRPPVRAVQKPATPDPAVPSAMARLDSLLKAGLRP
jgi:penicillin-binding protein 2